MNASAHPQTLFGPSTSYPTGNSPESVFIADLDGDSDNDLAVVNDDFPGTVSVLLNLFDIPVVAQGTRHCGYVADLRYLVFDLCD